MSTKLAGIPADAGGTTTKFTGRGMILGSPAPLPAPPPAQQATAQSSRDKKD